MNSQEQYDFDHTPDTCVLEVIEKMRETGYTEEGINTFWTRVLAECPELVKKENTDE